MFAPSVFGLLWVGQVVLGNTQVVGKITKAVLRLNRSPCVNRTSSKTATAAGVMDDSPPPSALRAKPKVVKRLQADKRQNARAVRRHACKKPAQQSPSRSRVRIACGKLAPRANRDAPVCSQAKALQHMPARAIGSHEQFEWPHKFVYTAMRVRRELGLSAAPQWDAIELQEEFAGYGTASVAMKGVVRSFNIFAKAAATACCKSCGDLSSACRAVLSKVSLVLSHVSQLMLGGWSDRGLMK